MRHFLAPAENFDGATVRLVAGEAHHIRTVLRMTPGDRIIVSVENVGEFDCSITQVERDLVIADILSKLEKPRDRRPGVTLAQVVPKGKKMDDIVRIACELGVERIIPVVSERRQGRLTADAAAKKTSRWRSIADAAAKQSRAGSPSRVSHPIDVTSLPGEVSDGLRVALWEKETKTLKSTLSSEPDPKSVLILAGPEGGLTEAEIYSLRSGGFVTASLGSRILRTQTAGIAGVIAAMYQYGD